jgi:hypothetical protein
MAGVALPVCYLMAPGCKDKATVLDLQVEDGKANQSPGAIGKELHEVCSQK